MEGDTGLFDLIQQGGLLMIPIILCSVIALAIIFERFWFLQASKIMPAKLFPMIISWLKKKKLDTKRLSELKQHSSLGRVVAAGLSNAKAGHNIMKDNVQSAVLHETHQMERYLNALGTVAAVTPLLGLLGTVIGMIDVFSMIVLQGAGNATILAGGISKALVTTAGGLFVAIPSLFFHRFFVRRIDEFALTMEHDVLKLIDSVSAEDLEAIFR